MTRSCFALSLLVALVGCGSSGPADYPVSGTVNWEGKPIPTGYINFYPTDSSGVSPDSGQIIDGKFAFRSKPGPKRIEVRADRELGPPDKFMGGIPREAYIPAKYNDQTVLKEDVPVGGKADYVFDLKK